MHNSQLSHIPEESIIPERFDISDSSNSSNSENLHD